MLPTASIWFNSSLTLHGASGSASWHYAAITYPNAVLFPVKKIFSFFELHLKTFRG